MNSKEHALKKISSINVSGNVVVHALLGHHVINASFVRPDPDSIQPGATTYQHISDREPMANLTGIIAGRVAVELYLRSLESPHAKLLSQGVRIDAAQPYADASRLPLDVGAPIARELLTHYWGAVLGVSNALMSTELHYLEADELIAATGLGDVEVSWIELCRLVRSAHPFDRDVRKHMEGMGQSITDTWARFIDMNITYGVVSSRKKRTALREMYARGKDPLIIQLTDE